MSASQQKDCEEFYCINLPRKLVRSKKTQSVVDLGGAQDVQTLAQVCRVEKRTNEDFPSLDHIHKPQISPPG